MSNERPWLDHYPAGVPAQIDVNEYASVPAVLEEAFGRFSERPAYASFGHELSYGEIDALSRQFAAYLTGVLKLVKGDRIAIMMPTCCNTPSPCSARCAPAWWW
jgi:Acyl-CoA synthetases (AMP-forming)/AMP-acid ligases II